MIRAGDHELIRLIASDRADDLNAALARFADRPATETLQVLEGALIDLRARRAHYASQLAEVEAAGNYAVTTIEPARLSLIG